MMDKLFAVFVVILGATVLTGWLLHEPSMVQINVNFVYMAFNTALLFILLAVGLLIPKKYPNFRQVYLTSISIIAIIFAGLIFLQDVLSINLGIDELFCKQSWINNYSSTPGRMAPQTAVCFILSGLILLLIQTKAKWLNFCVPILAIIIIGIAILSFTGYWLNLEIMYSWYKYTRMAMHTAVGFIFLGLALWGLWYRDSDDFGIFLNREDRRISAIGVAILSIIGLSAGMISFTLLAKQLENSTKENFSTILDNNSDLIRYLLKESVSSSRGITNHPLMNESVKEFNGSGSKQALEDIAKVLKSVSSDDYSAVKIYNLAEKELVKNGEFINQPDLKMMLDDNNDLLWKNGAYLHSKFKLKNNGEAVGYAIVERPLANLTEIFNKGQNIGQTGELMICSPVNAESMNCLPSRSHPYVLKNHPRKFEGQSIVMDYTLKGETGFHVAPDYTGHKVIAVGALLKPFPIGIVLKINSRELYAPIRQKLNWMVGVVIMLVITGIALLRSQLVPLVRKVILSEQQTRINEERLHLATSGTSDGLWDWNLITNEIYRSPRYIEMLGYNSDEEYAPYFNAGKMIHPDDLDYVMKNIQRHLETKEIYDAELRMRHKDGHYIWFNTRGQASWDENGKAVRITGFVTDISHRKETERLKNEFVSIVSHELRTPLTSIRGSLGLLLSGVGGQFSDKIRNLIEIAHKNCERLVLLINDILDIEKIESGQMRFDLEWLGIDKIIEQSVELNHAYAESHGVKFVLDKQLSTAEVHVDVNRLIQVITNLLSNAAKFSQPGDEIIIRTEEDATNVKILIIDHGSGIPKEFHSQIFGKFAQADSSAIRKKGGTGLGLNISKAIIEKFHGQINFISEGKGTTFFFILPKGSNTKTVLAGKSSAKLLICEDDADTAGLLKQLLEYQHYIADIAYTAAEAIEMLSTNNYEALILDLTLPDKDGLKFIEELRDNESTKKLPVIVVSAKAEDGKKHLQGRALNIVDWLAKPYDEARLIRAIKRIPSLSGKPTILHVEDDEDVAKVISYGLAGIAHILTASTLNEAKQHLANDHIDLILLDISLPDGSGLKLLESLNTDPAKPVIIFSAIEVSRSVSEKVSAALVKSRTSEDVIVTTIKSLLKLD